MGAHLVRPRRLNRDGPRRNVKIDEGEQWSSILHFHRVGQVATDDLIHGPLIKGEHESLSVSDILLNNWKIQRRRYNDTWADVSDRDNECELLLEICHLPKHLDSVLFDLGWIGSLNVEGPI